MGEESRKEGIAGEVWLEGVREEVVEKEAGREVAVDAFRAAAPSASLRTFREIDDITPLVGTPRAVRRRVRVRIRTPAELTTLSRS